MKFNSAKLSYLSDNQRKIQGNFYLK